MNEKTAYEQIISGKLQALPVPDMADAIWSRIEAQLDLDMPQAEPPNPTPRFPTGGNILGGISIVFVIALISYFLLQKKNNTQQPLQQYPANTTRIQKENETFERQKNTIKFTDAEVNQQPGTTILPSSPSDSNAATIPFFTNNDSIISEPITVSAPIPDPQKKDTVLPLKKGRGVTGLKEEDYRIVPKKDSANN